jgi:erythromycin esterase
MCSSVVDHMAAARDSYLGAGYSEWEVEWAIQNARIVAQAMDLARGSSNRDRDMARNIGWILDHNPDAKIVLWAHNGHVAAGGILNWSTMGSCLREKYGTEMVVFGFSFQSGGFQALDLVNSGLKEFQAPPAAEGSFDAALAAAGLPLFALDLRGAATDPAAAWFREARPARNIGAGYADVYEPNYYLNVVAPAAYDAVFFVGSTTRARPVQP